MPAMFISADKDDGKVLCMAQVPTSIISSKGLKANEWCQQVFLSAAEGQRPKNYLSCCCWIFRLIYALSTSTTMLPPIF